MNQGKILLIEDDHSLSRVLAKALEKEGHWVDEAPTGRLAMNALEANRYDLALVDIKLPDIQGLELLNQAKEASWECPFIVMTAQNTMKNAIEAMKAGAFDYLTKPFDLDELLIVVSRALERRRVSREFHELKEEVKKRYEPGFNMIGTSPAMQNVFKMIGQVVSMPVTVLLEGESGTGKELVAKTIHYNSGRWNKPLITVNCAAIPKELLESELFGHEKGAFTGALERRIGRFELANEGTIFLDEVGELPLELQTKLLRVLQEGEYTRVGGKEVQRSTARVIAATNQDLARAVREKRFREELYFRLKVIPIVLPALRERKPDLPLLVAYFIEKTNREMGTQISGISPDALKILEVYDWPGNVRELENSIIRAAVLSSGPILSARDFHLDDQRSRIAEYDNLSLEQIIRNKLEDYFQRTQGQNLDNLHSLVIERVERPLIELTLHETGGNQIKAAHILGINRNTLRKKISDLGIRFKKT